MASPENQPTPPFHVVAMPYPGRGHINPMLNLCKAMAERRSDLLITFVVTEEWLGLIGSINKPPNISFASVPNVVPSERVRGDDAYGFAMAVLSKMGEPFEWLLDKQRLAPPNLIVADALLPWAAEAAARRNIPLAYLWCMSASVYALLYHFDLLVQNGHFPVDLSVNGDAIVDYIPGLSPIRLSDLPPIIRDPEIPPVLLKIFPNESKAKYLIFDSISELESQVFEHLKQKSKFSIFNIGPADSYFKSINFINSTTTTTTHTNNNTDEYYLKWLDLQPLSSVLYISLGSFLYVSKAQMDEIAIGLHKSGVRFLWVARRETARYRDICGGNGLVVDWVDQLRVLCHSSVGGFWSHCGWNSTKEAVLAGVPVLTSPIIMDQLPNAKAIVEDWRIGWRVSEREFSEENLVKGDEIKEIVGRFLDLESLERGELVSYARELKMVFEREFVVGGSFETNLDGFVKSSLQHSSSSVVSNS